MGEGASIFEPSGQPSAAVFGGRGPGGVLVSPLAEQLSRSVTDLGLQLLGEAGSLVRAPTDGRVAEVIASGDTSTVVLDHGNGWQTRILGVEGLLAAIGDEVRRGGALGALGTDGALGFEVLLDGRRLDPRRYLPRRRRVGPSPASIEGPRR